MKQDVGGKNIYNEKSTGVLSMLCKQTSPRLSICCAPILGAAKIVCGLFTPDVECCCK